MKRERVIVFAGTEEGRKLFEYLYVCGVPVDLSVATEYGREMIEHGRHRVLVNRLDEQEMRELFQHNGYTLVIDATHPYATEVTENIQTSCYATGIPYLRVLRQSISEEGVVLCSDLSEAVNILSAGEGNILSAIGSKELAALTKIPSYQTRVFARMLPVPEALQTALSLGFPVKNLICMQGPFSKETNTALLRQFNCRYLLTKNSGTIGGVREKITAAKEAGAVPLVVGRSSKETGISYEDAVTLLNSRFGLNQQKHFRFPLFIDLKGKQLLVVGAGMVATRRVQTLLQFNCNIKVIAPDVSDEIQQLASAGKLLLEQREFSDRDLEGVFLVVSAAGCRETNHKVAMLAKEKGIYASIADSREECSFYFPAVVMKNQAVIGISGDGLHHQAVARTAKQIREKISDET